MKKHIFALLALVFALTGCPAADAPQPVDAAVFEASTSLDAAIGADAAPAPHRLGSFNPTCTGTGLPKIVSGVQTSACATIVDADVSSSAAIAGTKISPNFGSQAVVTTGSYSAGTNPAASGALRVPSASEANVRNNANSADLVAFTSNSSDNMIIGVASDFSSRAFGIVYINPASSVNVGSGGGTSTSVNITGVRTDALSVGSTNPTSGVAKFAIPIVGDSLAGPYSVHGKTTVATAPPFTLAAADYAMDAIMLSNAGAGTVTFPTPADDAHAYYKTVINTGAGTKTLSDGVGSPPTLATNLSGRYLMDRAGVHLLGTAVAYP